MGGLQKSMGWMYVILYRDGNEEAIDTGCFCMDCMSMDWGGLRCSSLFFGKIGSERLWLWGIGHLRYCFEKKDIFWFVFILCFGLHCLEMERNEKGY